MRSGKLPNNATRGKCVSCGDPTENRSKYYCNYCANRYRVRDKHRKENARIIVFEHYSKTSPPACVCCGETEKMFLSIDHINGGGQEDRKKRGNGTVMYQSLLRDGLPEGYQLLCMNCNHGRMRNNGICPHKGNNKVLPDIPPRKNGKKDFEKNIKKKDHYIARGRNNKFVLIILDKNYGRFYGGLFETKDAAEREYREKWNVQRKRNLYASSSK